MSVMIPGDVLLADGEIQVRSPYPGLVLDELVTVRVDGGSQLRGVESSAVGSRRGELRATRQCGPGRQIPSANGE
jgi:hypothetical protein